MRLKVWFGIVDLSTKGGTGLLKRAFTLWSMKNDEAIYGRIGFIYAAFPWFDLLLAFSITLYQSKWTVVTCSHCLCLPLKYTMQNCVLTFELKIIYIANELYHSLMTEPWIQASSFAAAASSSSLSLQEANTNLSHLTIT